jgi:NADH:ubiquinone oxidoreductase subunit 4 (subunit M)
MLRLMGQVFFGPFNVRWSDLKDLSALEVSAASLLLGAMLFMGVWWAPFTDRISATVLNFPGVS